MVLDWECPPVMFSRPSRCQHPDLPAQSYNFHGFLGQTATKLWIESPASASMRPYQQCRAWTSMIAQKLSRLSSFPNGTPGFYLIIFSLLWWTVCSAVETCVLNCSLRVNEGMMIEIVSKATAFSQSLSPSFVYPRFQTLNLLTNLHNFSNVTAFCFVFWASATRRVT